MHSEKHLHYRKIEVFCYEGYKGRETPRRFVMEGREHRVLLVMDRWCEQRAAAPHTRTACWRVKTEDGGEYVLRYEEKDDCWEAGFAEMSEGRNHVKDDSANHH